MLPWNLMAATCGTQWQQQEPASACLSDSPAGQASQAEQGWKEGRHAADPRCTTASCDWTPAWRSQHIVFSDDPSAEHCNTPLQQAKEVLWQRVPEGKRRSCRRITPGWQPDGSSVSSQRARARASRASGTAYGDVQTRPQGRLSCNATGTAAVCCPRLKPFYLCCRTACSDLSRTPVGRCLQRLSACERKARQRACTSPAKQIVIVEVGTLRQTLALALQTPATCTEAAPSDWSPVWGERSTQCGGPCL